VRGGREQVVTLKKGPSGLTATGSHVLYLEDLAVQPGDFVTYFARARDVGRGRKSLEVRSDIFFLEVKPYDEEFVAAQSQAGSSGNERSLEELAQAQKDIIVATWKLDRRALDAAPGRSQQDILQIARAQGEVQDRARETAAGLQFSMASRGLGGGRGTSRGAGPTTANPVFEALVKATVAMGRAKEELQALNTTSATPHEMEALNQILKALAEIRRRQVNRSQQSNASGGGNRAQRDLSTLFDRELRRQQETNYERSAASDRQDGQTESETLEKVRELARRQADLNRQQRDLANEQDQLSAEEAKRQLERLTREQTDLRQQAEELSRSLSEASGQGQARSGKGMREVSEQMRSAATDLRRSDPGQASRNSDKALEGLKQLERDLRGGAPGAADPESQKLADQLGRAQKAREQMTELQRRIDQLMQQIEALRGQQGPKPNGGRGQAGNEGPQGSPDKLARLQEELQTALGQARELMTELGRSEGGGFGVTPEGQQLSRSAAGIESYKQDFTKWDSLKKDINLAFERLEVSLARRLVEKESRERLNAGADSRVPEAYRELVDAYYRSLAKK
jgi:archaellum component FlaC